MDLSTSTREQLETLAQWLSDNAASEGPPAPVSWESFRQQMLDRATFLRTYVLRSASTDVPKNIPGSILDRPLPNAEALEVPTFLRDDGAPASRNLLRRESN